MDDDVDSEVTLVVVEVGAGWPTWAGEYRTIAPNSIVEAQLEGEPPAEFAARVVHRIADLEERDAWVRVAIFAVTSAATDAQRSERYRIARSALRAMSEAGCGELILTTSNGLEHIEDKVRHELFALAGTLCDDLRGTNISVSVRFGDATPQSGVMRSVRSASSLDDPMTLAANGAD